MIAGAASLNFGDIVNYIHTLNHFAKHGITPNPGCFCRCD